MNADVYFSVNLFQVVFAYCVCIVHMYVSAFYQVQSCEAGVKVNPLNSQGLAGG